jgi:hypothetical protein
MHKKFPLKRCNTAPLGQDMGIFRKPIFIIILNVQKFGK